MVSSIEAVSMVGPIEAEQWLASWRQNTWLAIKRSRIMTGSLIQYTVPRVPKTFIPMSSETEITLLQHILTCSDRRVLLTKEGI
ncbi:hypothetical protein PoB_001686500 [Plakobranchus ocellatus]|uniref:Uncharacterized protein n=1 Tax=Plakobranchus ocellatus TaxID=259542 RepID=A0AAV3Z5D0_9GAST|nr:hypothetical protein PoB_001686500 [Plakobranchus ocellatus]